MKQRAIVCVTNDLTTDQRVRKSCMTLTECGFEVLETGRLLPDSLPFNPPYTIRRPKLYFRTGVAFYAEYNIRLFFFLFFAKVDLIYSNDLDTLPACFLAAKLKGKKLIYDTHEYFTEMPELVNRKKVQGVWKLLERCIFPRLENIITVNQSIANLYAREYDKKVNVIRNIPPSYNPACIKSRKELNLPENKRIIILQGTGINIDRGAEEAVIAMKFLDDAVLLIVGSGDVISQLKKIVITEKLENKVIFKPKMSFEELRQHTLNADLGLALDKDTNLNYLLSLPNKLFDYIHSGIPVLASKLTEIKSIIDEFQIGYFIPSHNPVEIANEIDRIFSNQVLYLQKKENTLKAKSTLSWEIEKEKLKEIILSVK